MAEMSTPSPVALGDSSDSSSGKKVEGSIKDQEVASDSDLQSATSQTPSIDVPLKWKLMSIVMVSAIGFGSSWSTGITGAMKSTIKKELKINNTQFALLEASEDFMVTALILVSGLVTDRIGGAGKFSLL
jgi:hypothetical protein